MAGGQGLAGTPSAGAGPFLPLLLVHGAEPGCAGSSRPTLQGWPQLQPKWNCSATSRNILAKMHPFRGCSSGQRGSPWEARPSRETSIKEQISLDQHWWEIHKQQCFSVFFLGNVRYVTDTYVFKIITNNIFHYFPNTPQGGAEVPCSPISKGKGSGHPKPPSPGCGRCRPGQQAPVSDAHLSVFWSKRFPMHEQRARPVLQASSRGTAAWGRHPGHPWCQWGRMGPAPSADRSAPTLGNPQVIHVALLSTPRHTNTAVFEAEASSKSIFKFLCHRQGSLCEHTLGEQCRSCLDETPRSFRH